jgi:hypothetical protein
VRKLKEAIAEFRWGPLPDRRARGLAHLFDVLAGTGFHRKYWMVMGLLLGCMRDGGPIPWDRDADFGFLERDLPAFMDAFEKLKREGFSPCRLQVNNDGRITKWAVRREGLKFEFYLFEQRGDRLRWHFHHGREPRLEIVNEIPVHGLDEFELYGRRWLKPDNAETCLAALYGDWRTPDSNYVYWRDCAATVDRYPWSGERRRV